MYCSCFSRACSLTNCAALSRLIFNSSRYFLGCIALCGGRLISPVQLSFKIANGPRGSSIYLHGRSDLCCCVRHFSDCPYRKRNHLVPTPWIFKNCMMNHFLECLVPSFTDSGSF